MNHYWYLFKGHVARVNWPVAFGKVRDLRETVAAGKTHRAFNRVAEAEPRQNFPSEVLFGLEIRQT